MFSQSEYTIGVPFWSSLTDDVMMFVSYCFVPFGHFQLEAFVAVLTISQ